MKFPVKHTAIALMALSSTNLVLANNYVGASFGTAGVDYDSAQKSSDGYVLGRIFYGRAINELLSLETGLLTASSVDTNEDDNDSIKQDDLDMDIFFVALKGSLKLNDKHALFAKVGGNLYRYEIQNENQATYSEEGLGYSLSVGWEYALNNAFTTGLALQNLEMDKMASGALNLDLIYPF